MLCVSINRCMIIEDLILKALPTTVDIIWIVKYVRN